MYNPITILSQFLQILDKNSFDKFVRDHKADRYAKHSVHSVHGTSLLY